MDDQGRAACNSLRLGWYGLLMAWLAGGLLSGCCALPWRFSSNDRLVAAREQSRLGLEAMHAQRWDEARARFEHALARCPADAQLRHDLALVYWQQGERAAAIEAMDAAIGGSTYGEPEWLVELGRMLSQEHEVRGALEAVEQAIARQPDLAAAWALRGELMAQMGAEDEALRNYHRAVTGEGCWTDALMQMSALYLRAGRPRRALATLRRLRDTVPEERLPEGLGLHEVVALQALDRHVEALSLLAEARDKAGESPRLLVLRARSQWALGARAEAESALAAARRQAPEDPLVRAGLEGVDGQSPGEGEPRLARAQAEIPLGN